MVCNGCSLHYSVVVIATVPSRNPKDGDLGEIAGSLQFQALKPDLLWIFQNRSSPLNRTCSVCSLTPYVMLYRVPFPEDGTPKRIVFYRQCYARCSWHIHKRDHIRHAGCQSVRLQLLAHPKKRSSRRRSRSATGAILVVR